MWKSGPFARPGENRQENESMRQLRIFSYLPNPRIWKATIAARLAGVDIEVRGASPKELQSWLWDFDAHPISSGQKAGSGEDKYLDLSGRNPAARCYRVKEL